MALLFSAGTFLFVSTHVMAEIEASSSSGSHSLPTSLDDPAHISAKYRKRAKMAAFVMGMMVPLLLSTLLGHHH
jgi:hypothetical protein